jgi:AcrR family transcriptional regulator
MPRRLPQLTRETIAAVALEIADAEGFDAVSMRRVAHALGAGTMSLYYHVRDRDDLVAAMDDALMAELLLPAVPTPWQRAITEIARRTHAVLTRHPWAIASMASVPPGRNAMRHMEQCLEALAETAMTTRQQLTLLAAVDDFVFGHALRAAAAPANDDLALAAAQLRTGDFPRLAETFGAGRVDAGGGGDRFERGLRALLDADWE